MLNTMHSTEQGRRGPELVYVPPLRRGVERAEAPKNRTENNFAFEYDPAYHSTQKGRFGGVAVVGTAQTPPG